MLVPQAAAGQRTPTQKSKRCCWRDTKLSRSRFLIVDGGLIIGKGGYAIKLIEETTGSFVQIPQSAIPKNPSMCCISITCATEQGAESKNIQILKLTLSRTKFLTTTTTAGQTTILVVITTTLAISHLLQVTKSSYQTRMLDFA